MQACLSMLHRVMGESIIVRMQELVCVSVVFPLSFSWKEHYVRLTIDQNRTKMLYFECKRSAKAHGVATQVELVVVLTFKYSFTFLNIYTWLSIGIVLTDKGKK